MKINIYKADRAKAVTATRSIAVPNTVKQEEGEGDGDSGDGEPKR